MCTKFLASSRPMLIMPSVAAKSLGLHRTAKTKLEKTITIAVAQIKQETNSFSPVKTSIRDFEADGLYYAQDILPFARKEKKELGGFLKAVDDFGSGKVEIVPIIRATAESGGPVERDVYNRFKEVLLRGLRGLSKLDGIYLCLHGAMGVEGLYDPEGDLLHSVRAEVGTEIPIAVSLDLHANNTYRRVQLATFIVGFNTVPHRDKFNTGYKTGEILIKTINGEVKPTMAFRKMRLLKGGGVCIDFLPPMRRIFSTMKQMKRSVDVLSVSNFIVHIWLDEPELGWSTIAVTNNNPELAEKLAEEIAELNWSVRDVKHHEATTPSQAIKIARKAWLARKLGTVVFCDAFDAVEAGAPGESTWILRALAEEGADLISYVHVRDAEAAQAAFKVPLNGTLTVTVGGKLDKIYNRAFEITGQVVYKTRGRFGHTAVLKSKGVHLVLTELPAPADSPKFFTDLGLNLWKADIVVVKNLFPFRLSYLLYNRKTVDVGAPGVTNVYVHELGYKNITRPIYPLDNIDSWRW